MPIVDPAALEPLHLVPGVRLHISHGTNLMLAHVELDDRAVVPTHSHPHEQAGTVLSGTLRMTIDGVATDCEPGVYYWIPGGVPHSAQAVNGPCTVLDIFSPIREDYAKGTNDFV